MDLQTEFDRQVENLVQKGYPKLAGLSSIEFMKHIEPLKAQLNNLSIDEELKEGYLPFVVVIKSDLVSSEKALSVMERENEKGITVFTKEELQTYKPISEVSIPGSVAYLLVDIDRGAQTLNVAPNEAFEVIKKNKRSPLTIDEGIAIVTQFPEFLKKNNCFSCLASRCGDKRVPAIWISEKKPKLGWCWAGNPHTWLGSASCRARVGI